MRTIPLIESSRGSSFAARTGKKNASRRCPHYHLNKSPERKSLLERDAAALRRSMHELRQAGREHTLTAHVWQAEFARQHEKLVIVAGKIGELDKRILALVEGEDDRLDPESVT